MHTSTSQNAMITCTLLRYTEQGNWVSLDTPSFVTLIGKSISVRDLSSSTLQCDIPLSAVQSIDIIETSCMVRITTSSNFLLALKFDTLAMYVDFQQRMKSENIKFSDLIRSNSTVLPNLRMPHVQEYILRLLFSDNFRLPSS